MHGNYQLLMICTDLGNFSESAVSTVIGSDTFSKKLLVRIQIEVCFVLFTSMQVDCCWLVSNMQLPSLCSYQKLSYNISINNTNGSTIFVETFYHTGSGIVCHDIDINQDDAQGNGLELNKNYTLKVEARASFSHSEPVEICHEFGKLQYSEFVCIHWIIECIILIVDTNLSSAYRIQHKDFLLILLIILCFLN